MIKSTGSHVDNEYLLPSFAAIPFAIKRLFLVNRLSLGAIIFALLIVDGMAAQSDQSNDTVKSLGFGLGLPYAGLGVNSEYHINDNLGLGFSAGFLPFVGGLINASARYHLQNSNHLIQPRATLLVGHNYVGNYHCRDLGCVLLDNRSYVGLSTGFGVSLKLGARRRHALEIDVLFRVYSAGLNEDYKQARDSMEPVKKPGNWTPAIGYRYYF